MAKKRLTSLEDLGKLALEEKKKERKEQKKALFQSRPKPAAKPEAQAPSPEDDEAAFQAAMSGVKPMGDEAGRTMAGRPEPKPAALDPGDGTEGYLRKFLDGAIEFELEYTEEFMFGFVRGLDRKVFEQLKAGALSCEAHLDLHGLNAEQAYDNLLFFMRESYLQGRRCLLIIHGRGRNSPGGQGVLKKEIQHWLTREPLKRIVLAFCTAKPKDGGAGALSVLLRKQKKVQGKVVWDKMKNWEDEF